MELTKNTSLIREVIQNYKTPQGFIGWARAFDEHPEYKDVLGIKNKRDQHKLYVFAKRLDRGSSDSSNVSSKERKRIYQQKYRLKRRGLLSHQEALVQTQPVQVREVPTVQFCPCCGVSLEAINIALKMSNR